MSARWYKIVDAADVDTWMEHADCVTETPRTSADGSKAVLKFSTQVDGSIAHAAAISAMAGSEWRADSPGPS